MKLRRRWRRLGSCCGLALGWLCLAGCDAGTRTGSVESQSVAASAAPNADLEPLPVPSYLAEVDPPVRRQYEALRQSLDDLLADPPGHAVASRELGSAYGALGMWHHAYGDHGLAQLAYGHAAAHDDDPTWRYYLARVQGALGQTAAARQSFEAFLHARPDDVPSRVHWAEIELAAGRFDVAEALFEAALQRRPDTPRGLAGLGRTALQQREFERAAELLQRALELQPGRSKVEYSLGLAYRGLGDRERAAELMQRGVIDNRDKRDASMVDPLMAAVDALNAGARQHGQQGRRAFVEGDFAAAIAAARRAVEANPEAPQARLNLGAALLRAERPVEALATLEETLEMSPGHPIVHFNQAATHFRLGDLEAAQRHYTAAVKANPGFKEARFNLGNLLRRQGDCRGALQQYEQVVRLDPRLALARVLQMACLLRLERPDAAQRVLVEGLAELPGNRWLQLAEVRLLATSEALQRQQGKEALTSRAVALGEELQRANPRLAEAEAVAAAWAARGDFEAAVAWQRAALDAVREKASGPALARLASRLADYRRGQPDRTFWHADVLQGAGLPVAAPNPLPGS